MTRFPLGISLVVAFAVSAPRIVTAQGVAPVHTVRHPACSVAPGGELVGFKTPEPKRVHSTGSGISPA